MSFRCLQVICALAFGAAALAGTPAGEPTGSPPSSASADSSWDKERSDWKVRIYPLFAWAPVFGAHVDLPPIGSNLPGGPGVESGSTSGSINGAAAAAFDIQKSGWSTTGNFLWTSLSGDETRPLVHIGLDVVLAQVMGGYEVLPHLSLEGGARRMALKISASVNDFPEVSRKPGVWDPLVGLTYRAQPGRKWLITAHMDGGGFGVGTDVSVGASARADWMFAKHFGVTMGAAALHFQISNTVLQKTLVMRQTIYGPTFGFGLYF